MKKAAAVLIPVARSRSAEPTRAAVRQAVPKNAHDAPKREKTAGPAGRSSEATLLKCEVCGRYVVSSETERHIREVHAGQPVEWQKTR